MKTSLMLIKVKYELYNSYNKMSYNMSAMKQKNLNAFPREIIFTRLVLAVIFKLHVSKKIKCYL